MTKLIIGCGYLGLRVARRWRAAGHDVLCLVRTAEHAGQLAREGLHSLVADVTRPETLVGLPAAASVLWAVGFDAAGGRSRREVYVQGLQNVLAALPADTGRFLFVSSTSVYGNTRGGWVDENSPCQPGREAGRVLLVAEDALRHHALGPQSIILRLAGLYGPGRLPRLTDSGGSAGAQHPRGGPGGMVGSP